MPADGGIRFGQYVLLRRIARGGMAEVFLAQQRGLEGFDRRVAVKRILPHLADSPDFVKMFLGEAKLVAQLTHPNIVHIYDFGKVEGDYFIAMEFVDGVHAGQLFKFGEQRERVPPTLVARIGADAAAALHYAHELRAPSGKPYGLVHRDVSPANLMVSFDGVVKLCDFGIAKAAALSDQLTNPGQVKGKYAYMSPEQTVASPLDGRSDVFSLAIVLWELLTGRFIVSRGDAVDAMRAIRDGKLEPIERAAPGTPPALARAINWALQTKREKRATAMDFAQALEAFIKSSPELATPMQLSAWIKTRFPRDGGTGQVPALDGVIGAPSPGTVVGPGTVAAPSTSAAPSKVQNPITPPTLIGASTQVGEPSDFDELAETRAVVPRDDDTTGSTTKKSVKAFREMLSRRAAEEPTVQGGPEAIVGDTTEVVEGFETVQRPSSPMFARERAPLPKPGVASAPTVVVQVPPSGPQRAPTVPPIPGSAPRPMPPLTETLRHPTGGPPVRATPIPSELQRRKKTIILASALLGIALLSFMIALAASGGKQAATRDAGVPDAQRAAAVLDAELIEIEPTDAAMMVPTIPIDAELAATDAGDRPTALLVIETRPTGATILVGDQQRVSPTKLALPAGHYTVTAELEGYVPLKREVDLDYGVQHLIEMAFTKKISTPVRQTTGRLAVKTNPYSDVYENGKKLAQTPAELEMAVGTHVLVFKNPDHKPVTKTVKVTAGKTAKLSFDLP